MADVAPLDFVVELVFMMHPIALPLWGAGLAFFFTRRGHSFRVLGWTYLVCFVLLLALQGKPYSLAPAYPVLLASGAVALSRLVRQWRPHVLRPLVVGTLLAGGVALAPMGVPVLPPPAMAQYLDTFGLQPESEIRKPLSLPQDYADMLGWPEMVIAIARVYHNLPPTHQSRAVLFGDNYGHAGAIDYDGPAFGLPSAISASSSYDIRGPSERSGAVTIFLGLSKREVSKYFARCTTKTVVRHPWARENEEPIVVCRSPHGTFSEVWPSLDPW